MAEDCIFCKIVKGDIPSAMVYQDEQVFAFLDINPISPGHCLVVPKSHFEQISDCPEPVLSALMRPIGAIARAIVSAVGASGYNVLNNNGRSAGQLVDHVHFHVIPRKVADGVFHRWPAGKYPPGQMEQTALKIREALSR